MAKKKLRSQFPYFKKNVRGLFNLIKNILLTKKKMTEKHGFGASRSMLEISRTDVGFFDVESDYNTGHRKYRDLESFDKCSQAQRIYLEQRVEKLEKQIDWLFNRMFFVGENLLEIRQEVQDNCETVDKLERQTSSKINELEENVAGVDNRVYDLERKTDDMSDDYSR
jgi:hypothetical protein